MNVIGSRPDGWWRDRAGAMRRLVESLRERQRELGAPLTVVFDGLPPVTLPDAGAVDVEFASSADDAIVDRVAADGDPESLTVVTSDAELADRVRAHGARVEGSGGFRRRLPE